MRDIDDIEKNAVEYASTMAGEYLESIGKFDLSDLSPDQWQEFIWIVAKNYTLKKLS